MGGFVPLGYKLHLRGLLLRLRGCTPGCAVFTRLAVPARLGAWPAVVDYTGAGELLLLADFCKGAGSPCAVQVCGRACKKRLGRGHSARKA